MTRPWCAALWQHWSHCQVLFSQFGSVPMWDAVEALVRELLNVHQYASLTWETCWKPLYKQRKGGTEVCYRGEKSSPLCEWQVSETHEDIALPRWHSLSGRELTAKDMANPAVLSQGAANTHTHIGGLQSLCQATLTSPSPHVTLNPHLCFALRVPKHPVLSQVFLICPVPCGLEELQCAGCEP